MAWRNCNVEEGDVIVNYDSKNNMIIFKSSSDMFQLEKCGKKCNTIRLYYNDLSEILPDIDRDKYKILKIKIINVETLEYFERLISNITQYAVRDSIVIVFSWYHQSLTYGQIDDQAN